MFLAAILSLAVAICLCLLAIRKTFAVLGLDPMRTFMWLGLAEVPTPRTRRRARCA